MQDQASVLSSVDSHVLDVHYKHWRSNISVNDSATGQQLYCLDASGCHNLLTTTNESGQAIGSSKTHSLSSRIDIEIISTTGVSTTFEIRNNKIIGGSPCYKSPAFEGQEMTWKNKAMSTKIIYTLVDGQGIALAKFKSDPKSKVGKLQISDTVAEQDRVNETVVTVLTLLYRKMLSIQSAAVVAATA